ncbi:SRA-YDG [Macleaya cordata]|uniref:SRA-YDG n=1 Tax=Macleaya cordata TaxID=56857 RepID=A0A200QRK9_MACCD|nr:SRA-YDG [Macleaya cordata]
MADGNHNAVMQAIQDYRVIQNQIGITDKKVCRTLELFSHVCKNLKWCKEQDGEDCRFDTKAYKTLQEVGQLVVTKEQKILGDVPGIHIGQLFNYKTELAACGLHGYYVGGIDYLALKVAGGEKVVLVAVSIVTNFDNDDDDEMEDAAAVPAPTPGTLKYKLPQKLKKGILALSNNKEYGVHVRVIRDVRRDRDDGLGYSYAGLFLVQSFNKNAIGEYEFELRRTN